MSYEEILKESGRLEPSDKTMDLINFLCSSERDLQTEIIYHDLKQQYLFVVAEGLNDSGKWVRYSSGHIVVS